MLCDETRSVFGFFFRGLIFDLQSAKRLLVIPLKSVRDPLVYFFEKSRKKLRKENENDSIITII